MTVGEDDGLVGSGSVDLAIRLGFLALVGYWSFRVIAPFATILLWSAILAVALYPLFEWLRRRVRPGLAAGLGSRVRVLRDVLFDSRRWSRDMARFGDGQRDRHSRHRTQQRAHFPSSTARVCEELARRR